MITKVVPKEEKIGETGAFVPPIPRVELHIVIDGQKQGGKGRNKGKGNQGSCGGQTGKCWACGEPGHIAENCPKKVSTSLGNT